MNYHWLQITMHFFALIPLAVLFYRFLTNQLTVNPIQAATQRTGDTAIVLLILSLSCTPIFSLFRYSPVLKIRRALGLYAYLYATIHFFIFVAIDYGFALDLIIKDVANKRFILVGLVSFILLTILAVTSFRRSISRLGKNWKRLHRIVYVVNLFVVLHYAWAMKGDLFRLQGNIIYPAIAGSIVILLLVLRIPMVRKRITGIFSSKGQISRLPQQQVAIKIPLKENTPHAKI